MALPIDSLSNEKDDFSDSGGVAAGGLSGGLERCSSAGASDEGEDDSVCAW